MNLARLISLCALAMCFFAANSLLTRAALADNSIGAGLFGLYRLIAGAVTLAVLVKLRGGALDLFRTRHILSVLALFSYMVGFSLAYLWLGAGVGALILFAGVQITMFAGALRGGEAVPLMRWVGMGVALSGLAVLYLPGAEQPPLAGVGFMMIAAVGWGIYSLCGRGSSTPLASTAANFIWASGLMAVIPWALFDPTPSTLYGVVLAVIAGSLASGVGYSIWYLVLPHLRATRASVVQLSAPILALIGGAAFLGEPLSPTAVLAAVLVVGGVMVSLRAT